MGIYERRLQPRAIATAAALAGVCVASSALARPPTTLPPVPREAASQAPSPAPESSARPAAPPAAPPDSAAPAPPPDQASPTLADDTAAPVDPTGGFTTPFQPKPPPLHVEYLQYGVAIAVNSRLASGATCPDEADTPCILGGGGGLVVRVGWRPPGPWYWGAAYEFAKMDSGNLYRLGVLQQARAEVRYMPETGLRVAPYVSGGLGGFAYGNEWGVETGGAVATLGGGFEFEVTRFALVGVGLSYVPMLIAGWTDTANQERDTSLAQFLRLELVFELRSELSREDQNAREVAQTP